MDISLRDMRVGTCRLSSLSRTLFGLPWTEDMFREELAQDMSWRQWRLTRPHGIGFAVGRRYPDVWHLMDLAVAPAAGVEGWAGVFSRVS